MSIIDELITDRTQADVDRQLYLDSLWNPFYNRFSGTAAERSEWLQGTKGTYRASDLNRVGEAILYVAERLRAAGYAVEVSPVTDWKDSDYITPSVAEKLLKELRELRSKFAQMPGTPQVPADMENMTVQDANNMEIILADVDRLLGNIIAAWYSSGELYSGEV